MVEADENADVVVIGAGLSGLVNAILLAETGRRVVVFEQHSAPGGFLQQFTRKGTTFDVGFHYVGSTLAGRPLRRMLEYLEVWNELEVLALPEDGAISLRDGDRTFDLPATWGGFLAKARAVWSHERAAIDRFAVEVDSYCASLKWFALEDSLPTEGAERRESFAAYAARRFDDPWLRRVLGLQSFNLGLHDHEIPWTKHVLAFRANFDATCRIRGGGGALIAALRGRAERLGVIFRFREGIERLECTDRRVRTAATSTGSRIEANLVVATCHPKVVVAMLSEDDLAPAFRNRILDFKDSRGAFQVFLRLSSPPRSLEASCLLLADEVEAQGDPPMPIFLVVNPGSRECGDPRQSRLEIMTYVDQMPFRRWAESRTMRRGDAYEDLKRRLADRVLRAVGRVVPDLSELIEDIYTATPLTDESYTRSSHGAVFGVSHDISQQGLDRPHTRTRLKNLYYSGHSIAMPGICGVVVNAFETADVVRGDGRLFAALSDR